MPYADFTLERVEAELDLLIEPGDLFADLPPEPVPVWLDELLLRNRRAAAFTGEKARSEFIVAPILTTAVQYATGPLAIFSGQRLDVDRSRNLFGECDFILARTTPLPRLKAPLLTIVEAKWGDIELGIGQCVAQMVAARLFNEQAQLTGQPIFGCVTSGEDWQFLRLDGPLIYDTQRRYLDNLGGILAVFRAIIQGGTHSRGLDGGGGLVSEHEQPSV